MAVAPTFPTVIIEGGKIDPSSMQSTINQLNNKVNSLTTVSLTLPELDVPASRNVVLTDSSYTLSSNQASPVNVTILQNAVVPYPAGTILSLYQANTGAATFIADAGVTFQGTTPTPTQFSAVNIRYRGNDIWTWLTSTVSGTAGAAVFATTMANLRTLAKPSSDGTPAFLRGYYAQDDGGEGTCLWNATSTATDNGGTVIQANAGGTGRWIRITQDDDEFFVNWFGAKPSNNISDATTNATAIQATMAAAFAYASSIGTGFDLKVKFGAGNYYSDSINMNYANVGLIGQGSGVTRLIHSNTQVMPLIYVFGGNSAAAWPYGGIQKITCIAGTNTFPAIVYVNTAVDNQVSWEDFAVAGSGAANTCDGLSICNFLNMTMNKFRCDGIGGYGLTVRHSIAKSNQAFTPGGNAWVDYKWTVYDSTTGIITFTATNSEMFNGTAVVMFTTGVLPTRTSTSVALVGTSQVYFMGNVTETHCTLHDTEANARAGTSPILLTAATGSGTHQMCNFPSSFQVTSAPAGTGGITFTNDKRALIPTSVAESRSATYGSGHTQTMSATGGVHYVIPTVTQGGTLDSALTASTVYYPIYLASNKIALATTVANAVAGTAISLTGNGSQMVLLYDSNVGILGIGGLSLSNVTYDNAGAGTLTTQNTVPRGGLGLLYANYNMEAQKGTITIEGHRIEVNKLPAKDPMCNGENALIRIEVGRADFNTGSPLLPININRMQFDLNVSIRGDGLRILGNMGSADLSYKFDDACRAFGYGCIYNNDRGNATSKTMSMTQGQNQQLLGVVGNRGFSNLGTNSNRLTGAYFTSLDGKQTSIFNLSQLANSTFKSGDLLLSNDLGVVYYQAVQTTKGWSKGTGATNATGTTVSGTAGNTFFTLTAQPSEANFSNGATITIPGAGVAAANITGTIANLVAFGTGTYSFELHDETTGEIIPCTTTVATVTATYPAVIISQVPSVHVVSATLDFPSTAAQTTSTLTIAAPANVTFRASACIRLGAPVPPSGGSFSAYITGGGGSITVVFSNPTSGALDPASATFRCEVSAY